MRASRFRAVVTALLLVAGVAARASAQTLVVPGTTFTLLENYLESLRQQAGIPGMSAIVLKDGETVWEKGFGFQNVASRIRATPDTPYMVGDLSGTVAAVLLLQCVEQRRLELDQPFARYGLPAADPESTLRTVLSHTVTDGVRSTFAYAPDRYDRLTPVMEWCAPQAYRKSVAHRVLNAEAMRDSVPGTDLLDPTLSLPEGLFDPDDLQRYRDVLARMAVPYRVDAKGRAERADVPMVPMSAAAGLVSTVRDLAELDKGLDTLLLDATRQLAWTPVVGRDGTVLPMGLGWFVQSYRGVRLVWHFGYVPGAYSSLLVKLPDQHLTFILLANSDGLSAPYNLAAGDVTRSLFAQVFLRFAIR